MTLFSSQPFTVPRVVLARAAAEAYVRQFWWFILPGPLFGLVMMLFAREPYEQAFASLLFMWPISIPFRAYVLTGGLARKLKKPTTMVATDKALLFSNEDSKFLVRYEVLRQATVRNGMLVLRSRRFDAIIVPLRAFKDDEGQRAFLQVLSSHGIRTTGKGFLEI